MKQLISLSLVAPGSSGLNKQLSNSLLPPEWATIAENTVIDEAGRLAARAGLQDLTTTPISGNHPIEVIHEFRKANGTTELINAANEDIFKSLDGGATFVDITGTLTPAASNWQFTNFEDKCIGIQQGETPILYTGTGNFTTIVPSGGTAPTGNTGVAAYGRLWIADADKKTIKYCGLLDELDWNSAGSGTILMENVWDVDEIVGIAAFANRLVVFGKRNIVIWADAIGSTVGLDPSNLFVEDIISGTGLVSRDTIQTIGEGDLLYYSPHGIQSLLRIIQEKNNPVVTVTRNVTDYLDGFFHAETGEIRTAYDMERGYYILIFPSQDRQFIINTRRQNQDGSFAVTDWTMSTLNSVVYRNDTTLVFGLTNGQLGSNASNADLGLNFTMNYRSGWLDMGPEVAGFLKILKRWQSVIFIESAANVSFTVYKDFAVTGTSSTSVLTGDSSAEWGNSTVGSASLAEWGLAEWSGGLALREVPRNLSGTAQYIQLGLTTDAASEISIQQFNLIAKRGRFAA